MKSLHVSMVVFGMLFLGTSGCMPQGDPSVEGSWIVVSVQQERKEVPKRDFQGDEFSFAGGKMTATKRGEKQVLAYKLHATTKPRSIDFEEVVGDPRKKLAIYEINGDELKLCINNQGNERPTAFQTDEAGKMSLVTLKRKK